MPHVDSTASAALAIDFAPAWFIYLNISGDPLRITTFGQNVIFGAGATGDADLDTFTYNAFDGRALDIGDVTNSEAGSDTLTITLSGITGIDASLLADIANRSLWQGRDARLWFQLYDVNGVTSQGAIVPYYTGKMSKVGVSPGQKTQEIHLSVENYLAAFNDASNRSYLNQSTYDSADVSAAATLAAANGAVKSGVGVDAQNAGGTGRGGNQFGGRVWNV